MERDRERAVWETEALKRGVENIGVDVTINSEGVHADYQDPYGGRSKNSQFFHSNLAKKALAAQPHQHPPRIRSSCDVGFFMRGWIECGAWVQSK